MVMMPVRIHYIGHSIHQKIFFLFFVCDNPTAQRRKLTKLFDYNRQNYNGQKAGGCGYISILCSIILLSLQQLLLMMFH